MASVFEKDPAEKDSTYHEATGGADHVATAKLLDEIGRILLAVGAQENVANLTLSVLILGIHHVESHLGRGRAGVPGSYC